MTGDGRRTAGELLRLIFELEEKFPDAMAFLREKVLDPTLSARQIAEKHGTTHDRVVRKLTALVVFMPDLAPLLSFRRADGSQSRIHAAAAFTRKKRSNS